MRKSMLGCLSICIVMISTPVCRAGDWPCCNADVARSGVGNEQPAFPLSLSWEYRAAQPPDPAWPEPGRSLHLMDFDYAFQPVVSEGLVFFGSSADDSVRALDERTGDEQWRFTTRGPVRFAPHVAYGNCFFAGDDGFVYCLNARSGEPVWEFRAAPDDRMAVGNERMISRSPCRSGVLVLDGVVYVTAGLWPSEGIDVYALDAQTGKVIRRNDTTGTMYIRYPHAPSVSFGGPSPQGYLLSAGNILLVPTGKALPAAFDLNTCELLYYRVEAGGSWAVIAGDTFFTHKVAFQPSHGITHFGENGPAPGDGIAAFDLATGRNEWKFADGYFESITKASDAEAEKTMDGLIDRERVLFNNGVLYAVGNGIVEALDCSDDGRIRRLWTGEHGRAYSIALAGDALFLGGAGTVTAYNTKNGERIWVERVDGQARGLAVSNGRLFTTTEKGTIYAFASSQSQETPPVIHSARVPERIETDADGKDADAVLKRVPNAELLKGYALILGATDTKVARMFAERTQLHVICVLSDESKVLYERKRLIEETNLYGSRLVVYSRNGSSNLPYADYFANLVVVEGNGDGVSGKEMYRVLRPCGGRMLFTAGAVPEVRSLIKDAEIPQQEIVSEGDSVTVVRGKLSGAFDWDSEVAADRRVKWPLELLWFGGPGPDRMIARHWKAPTPVFANGRYFAVGQYHIICVDAYNGCELWSKWIGGNVSYRILKLAADDDSLYVNFPGVRYTPDEYCVRFDAQTGKILKVYGQMKPSPGFDLTEPRTFTTTKDGAGTGIIRIVNTSETVTLDLTTEPAPGLPEEARTQLRESWELNFDFRRPNACFEGDGPGILRLSLDPRTAKWSAGLGPQPPTIVVNAGQETNGTAVTIEIPWEGIRKLVGEMPRAFQFAAVLNTFDQEKRPVRLSQFADGLATFLNNGWAVFTLESAETNAAPAREMPVPHGDLSELPKYAVDWPRQPTQFTAYWTIDAYDKLEMEYWPPLERGAIPADRVLPITGLTGPRTITRSYGCGGTSSSVTTDFFRSGAIGIYDRMDDSGTRNFAAIKPGCGMTMAPAGGILISSEGAGDCVCPYNFQTSLALAPAKVRKNEDWAMFDGALGAAFVRDVAVNLGAPGDRRDDDGRLWLGFPRQPVALGIAKQGERPGEKYTFDLPCKLEFYEGFGPYRRNADHLQIKGTDRPWIYASGCEGLKRATLDLLYFAPKTCLALKTVEPPRIDADLGDSCWNGIAGIPVRDGNLNVYLRHDENNLYVACNRPAAVDRKGNVEPFCLTLRDGKNCRFVRLKVPPDGEPYLGRLDYSLSIPRLNCGVGFEPAPQHATLQAGCLRHNLDDWRKNGFSLDLTGGGSCRLGWNADGLLMLLDLPKGYSIQSAEFTGLLTMLARPDSIDFLQFAVDAASQEHSVDRRVRASNDIPDIGVGSNVSGLMHWGRPSGKLVEGDPNIGVAAIKTDNSGVFEIFFPWADIKMTPQSGDEICIQIVSYDPKKTDPLFKQGGDWRSGLLERAKTMCRLRLSEAPGPQPKGMNLKDERFGGIFSYTFEERADWKPEWTAASKVDNGTFLVETAVPWATLAEAGIRKDDLRIALAGSEPLVGEAQKTSNEFDGSAYRVDFDDSPTPLRTYTVRLHFAELGDVAPNERRFDIKIQGNPVLENFDVLTHAGDKNAAIIKEYGGIVADKTITIDLVPKDEKNVDKRTAPIISGIEVVAEG